MRGGSPLQGEMNCSGAKNAVLPVIAASLLSDDSMVVDNVPHLCDITTMLELLSCMGCEVSLRGTPLAELQVQLCSRQLHSVCAPYELVNTMRASVLTLGPLLARHQEAEVAMPGGCAIGPRPIDQHLEALSAMGAEIQVEGGIIRARSKGRLRGVAIELDMPTVTGTENIMMAASLAQGKTVITNAAREPEVVDLGRCLSAMGAEIEGIGTRVVSICGVESLQGCSHQVIPDRIEAGTYLCAAAATKGQVTVRHSAPEDMVVVCDKLRECGAQLQFGDNWIDLNMEGRRPRAVNIETAEYPGFPTDLQAQFLALNAGAVGDATVVETIFENRFRHAQEMNRMGAHIRIQGNSALSEGGDLAGAEVIASDLRASASLVIAGLVARGETVIGGIEHMDRGYERIEEKMQLLGADIRRIQ